jgi:hypothetical protein
MSGRSVCNGHLTSVLAYAKGRGSKVIALTTSPRYPGGDDLVSLELIGQTPGAHPISSVDELRCDVFNTEEELDDFLTFIASSRHAGLT